MTDDVLPDFGKPYLTVQEAAERLRVSRWTIFALLRSGDLQSFKPGRYRLIPVATIDAFVSRQLDEEVA